MEPRRNLNRGYQKLTVWQDARDLYSRTWRMFRNFPYLLSKVASHEIASVDSVHRNIAEGYCRRTLNEYLQFLNIAQGSLGESVSSMLVYKQAGHISQTDFDEWDQLAFKLENGLKKLIESLQNKRLSGEWQDSYVVRESNAIYRTKPLQKDGRPE